MSVWKPLLLFVCNVSLALSLGSCSLMSLLKESPTAQKTAQKYVKRPAKAAALTIATQAVSDLSEAPQGSYQPGHTPMGISGPEAQTVVCNYNVREEGILIWKKQVVYKICVGDNDWRKLSPEATAQYLQANHHHQ